MTDTPQTFIDLGDGNAPVAGSLAPKNDPERKFRDAWTKSGKTIVVDMDRARVIHRDALRAVRAPLLAQLDIASVRADEDGKSKADIIASKKALRDITKDARIDAATTPEALAALTLEMLLA